MNIDEERPRLAAGSARFRQPASGLLGKVLTFAAGAAMLVLAFTFSLLVLSIVVTGGLLAWGYLWWTTRELRSQMQQMRQMGMRERNDEGRVFEGEAIRDVKPDDQERHP